MAGRPIWWFERFVSSVRHQGRPGASVCPPMSHSLPGRHNMTTLDSLADPAAATVVITSYEQGQFLFRAGAVGSHRVHSSSLPRTEPRGTLS